MGNSGILYNPETTKGINFNTWNSLWYKRLKDDVLIVDGSREGIGFALNSMNESLNETNKQKLKKRKIN